MSQRLLSRVGGFVHDIGTVSALSDEPNNIRLLSDRSLYILQNLSSEDITFLSRYGEMLEGDLYLPVLAGSPQEADVEAAVDIMRRDLNSMAIDELLECICANLGELVAKTDDTSQEVEGSLSDGVVTTGEGEQFETQAEYFDAKCNTANGIFDTVRGLVQWLEDNDVDIIAGVFGGVTTGILVGLGLAGPLGWALALVAATTVSISGYMIRYALNFADMGDALDDTHDECVLALFNAGDAKTAENNFIAEVEAGSPVITALESGLLRIFLSSEMVNQLFAPRSDVAVYQSAAPVDCGSAILALWTFLADEDGFSFSDDSTPPSSASGAYDSGLQALGCTLVSAAGGARSRASWEKTGLSIAVTPGASAQFDYTKTSDGKNQSKYMLVTYSDASFEEKTVPNTSGAGTLVLTLSEAKTISSVLVEISRSYTPGSTHTTEVLEVRIIGV